MEVAKSGAYKSYGLDALKGVQLAVDKINAAGGVKVGSTTRQIELVVRNDNSDPDTARSATTQLITSDKVDMVLGGVGTNLVGPALLVAERYHVPMMATYAYAPTVLPPNPKYAFVNIFSTVDESAGPLRFFQSQGVKSVVLAASNDELGSGFAKEMPDLLKENGLTQAGLVRFDAATKDLAPVIANLKKYKADALMVEAPDPLTYAFRQAQVQYQACDYKASLYEIGPNLQPNWPEGAGKYAEGAIGGSYWWPTSKGAADKWFTDNQGVVEALQSGGGTANVSMIQGVQSVELMALAVEAAGSTDADKVVAALNGLSGTTFLGPIKFEGNFNVGMGDDFSVVQQQGPSTDDAKIVFPDSVAQASYQQPDC
jgi:branched-chain amino acid transport system substrate-binding protein